MNIKSMAPRLWGRRRGKTLALLAMALFMGLAWTTPSHAASTAAYTTIRNDVTVRYADAGGNPQTNLNAYVEFSVALVASTPILNSPSNQEINSDGTALYYYTITSTANGPDGYSLSSTLTDSAGIDPVNPSTVEINGGNLNISLGATTAAGEILIIDTTIGTTTTISVPSDLDNSDNEVNGIGVDDVVVIDDVEFLVTAITDHGGVGTSDITVTYNGTEAFTGTPPSLAVGDIIGERANFTVEITPGIITDATTDQIITLNLVAQDDDSTADPIDDTTETTVNGLSVQVHKYVRNVDTHQVGSGLQVDLGSEYVYYSDGIEGAPGQTMEYLVQITNGPETSPATGLIIIDHIPQFTTYVENSMELDPGTGSFTGLNDDANGVSDAGEYDSDNQIIYIYAGEGGEDGNAADTYDDGTGGTLAADHTTYGRFRVTINN